MVTDFFGTFLQELGPLLQLPNLSPDTNNSCLIKFKGDVQIQMEIDRTTQFLILGSDLGAVPVGRYRENLFEIALKANALPPPRHGTFAYSKQTDHLILFQMFNLREVTATQISEFIIVFIEKIRGWKEAIIRGELPLLSLPAQQSRPSGMFGLR